MATNPRTDRDAHWGRTQQKAVREQLEGGGEVDHSSTRTLLEQLRAFTSLSSRRHFMPCDQLLP